jgi:multidrug efflux pump subunit AcrA (membrane-fusion protein)
VAQGNADIAEARRALEEARSRGVSPADRSALDTAERNYQRAREDRDAAITRGQANVDAAQQALQNAIAAHEYLLLNDPLNSSAIASALAEAERMQAALNTAQNAMDDNVSSAARRVEDARAGLRQAEQSFDGGREGEIERAEAALTTAQNRASDNRLAASRRLEDAAASLQQAQQNFTNHHENDIERAQAALETAESRAEDNLLSATRRLEDASHSVSSEVERAQNALQTAIGRASDNRRSSARRVEDAITSLAAAELTHQRNTQQNADTAAQNRITATTLTLDISAQQDIVDTLDNLISSSGILYADVGGVVATAMIKGSVTAKTPIASIRDTEGGFEAQMQIHRAEAENLFVGRESEVTTGGGNMFFTPTVTGVVSAISAPDDNDRVTITIALPESNWNVGQRIDTQIVLSRGSYDMSIPVSALRSDNVGHFVYVVGQRNTVLGLQNVVERVNVNVTASDNDTVSITGPVSRSCQVISGSNRAVNVGDRVRVNEQ